MKQSDLNRAVSRATGETIDEIAHHGFTLLAPLPHEPTPEALISRWRQSHPGRRRGRRRRRTPFVQQRPSRAA